MIKKTAIALALIAVASAPVAHADYSAEELTQIGKILRKCNDMPSAETVHARADKALQIMQDDGTPLLPGENVISVEKFVALSVPDDVGPQKCVDVMAAYVTERESGIITRM